MSTPLSTYLSTPATGAPATSALELVSGMSPQEWVDANGLPQYTPAQVADVEILAASQAKYDPVLYPQPSVGTPIGIQTGTLIALNAQAIKDIKSKLPIGLKATTSGGGTVTVDLTSYGFSAAPIVSLTATSNTLPYVTALSSTSLSITGGASSDIHVVLVPQ